MIEEKDKTTKVKVANVVTDTDKQDNYDAAKEKMYKRQEERKKKAEAKAILDGKIATTPEEADEIEDELEEMEEAPVMASFASTFAERRWCLVPVMGISGKKEYIKVFSISTKQRDEMTTQCQTKKWNKNTKRAEVTDFNGERFADLVLIECLDDEFIKTIPGKDKDEKIKNLKEKIPSYDLGFILDVSQHISGLDMDNIELIKKEFGLVACQTKPILTQLLNL